MDALKDAVRLFADVGGTDEPQPDWKFVEW